MVWKIILQDFYKQVEWRKLKVILSLKEIIPSPQIPVCMNSVSKEFKLIHPILSGWVWWSTCISSNPREMGTISLASRTMQTGIPTIDHIAILVLLLLLFLKVTSNIWWVSFFKKFNPFSFAQHSTLYQQPMNGHSSLINHFSLSLLPEPSYLFSFLFF